MKKWYEHDGDDVIGVFYMCTLEDLKRVWDSALDSVEFDSFSGPRCTIGFEDWLKEQEGRK